MTKRIFKFFAVILSTVLLFSIVCITVCAQESSDDMTFSEEAEAVYLYSYDANRVLISNGNSKILSPGPSAKIMTGLIACRILSNELDKKVEITAKMLEGVEGNSMNLRSGMTVTVRELLYGTICGGNNDAAQALAIVCSKSVSEFVKKMNLYTSELYMQNTIYANPSGLDNDKARTTISDVAILAKAASENELYMSISSSASFEIKPLGADSFTVYNRNALVSQFSAQGYINKNAKGIIAGKDDSGFFVCAVGQADEAKYLCVVMGAASDSEEIYSYYIANELFNYAFNSFGLKKLANAGDKLASLNVSLAVGENENVSVDCVLPSDVYAFLPNDADLDKSLKHKVYFHDKSLIAPIEKDTVVGGVDVYYNGELIATSKLVAGETIQENGILAFLSNAKDFLTSRTFMIFICIFITALIVYLYFDFRGSRHKRVVTVQYKKFY